MKEHTIQLLLQWDLNKDMEIKVLKTYEIDDSLWAQITEGFIESFEREVSIERMKKSFCVRNRFGYGYHAIAISDDGEVMGYNVFSPVYYKNGLNTVVSGSTYVRKKYRTHEFLFMDMVKALRKVVIQDGFDVEIGVPNHNSERFAIKILKFKLVGELDYYFLPFNFSRSLNKPSLKCLDWVIKFFSNVHVFFQTRLANLANTYEKNVKYELDLDEHFWDYRFPIDTYKRFREGNYHAYWLPYKENGANAVYLLDFREDNKRTYRSLMKAINVIKESKDVDMILFVGYLHLKQFVLLKCPKLFIPKRLPFTYYLLNKTSKEKYSDMESIFNWNFSLMNFDAR